MEYKPGMAPPTTAAAPPTTGADTASCPYTRVTEQGDLVRKLKAEQAPKVPGSFIFDFSQLCVLVSFSRHSLSRSSVLAFHLV